ncbi:MAG: acyl-homoserine-lactone synthase [Halofilum sp. (in: g-proteobacteria)]
MDTIALDRGFGQRADPYSLHNMYRLRHEVFHERLGWEVTSAQGLEQDEYDALQPVYLITRGPQREVTGCLRLLPTSGPYMLRDTFPQLLAGETPPADARIWDISRMAVAKPVGRDGVRSATNDATVELVAGVLTHGLERGIDRYVAVVSVAFERILRRMGLAMHRFGDGQARWMGDTLSVAVWIEVDADVRDAILERHQQREAA